MHPLQCRTTCCTFDRWNWGTLENRLNGRPPSSAMQACGEKAQMLVGKLYIGRTTKLTLINNVFTKGNKYEEKEIELDLLR